MPMSPLTVSALIGNTPLSDALIRLSIGIENVADLRIDLQRALAAI